MPLAVSTRVKRLTNKLSVAAAFGVAGLCTAISCDRAKTIAPPAFSVLGIRLGASYEDLVSAYGPGEITLSRFICPTTALCETYIHRFPTPATIGRFEQRSIRDQAVVTVTAAKFDNHSVVMGINRLTHTRGSPSEQAITIEDRLDRFVEVFGAPPHRYDGRDHLKAWTTTVWLRTIPTTCCGSQVGVMSVNIVCDLVWEHGDRCSLRYEDLSVFLLPTTQFSLVTK
jgi:hypothetical protein